MCLCTEYKLSVLQVGLSEENKLNATTQQFITAKIPCCALKKGSKTYSSMRQSNLQLQIAAALMSCRIRAVEHRKCAAGLACAYIGLQDLILLNCTKIGNAHKVRKKKVQQTFHFLSPWWDIIKCLNAFMLTTAVFELVQQFCHVIQKLVTQPMR